MSNSKDEMADLLAIENSLMGRAADFRRRRQAIKRELIDAGEVERLVTDHAVLRYMERHKGIDIEGIRAELRVIAGEAVLVGDEHYWHSGAGAILILGEDGQVITVLSPEHLEKWSSRIEKHAAPKEKPAA